MKNEFENIDKVTLVTAVNQKYLTKFNSNFNDWLCTDLVQNIKNIIVFYHVELEPADLNISKIDLPRNCKLQLIPWRFDLASSQREEMLTAFVFGVAQHVKTKWWIKLDCDVKPKLKNIKLPDLWHKYTLNGHQWGYTKIKSDNAWDGGTEKHWLNRLDDWADSLQDFEGTERLFPEEITTAKYSHSRVCTFFAIEKTAWTIHLYDMCMRTGGRMPIPSQDTLSWYGITRLGDGRTVNRYNFKRYWQP